MYPIIIIIGWFLGLISSILHSLHDIVEYNLDECRCNKYPTSWTGLQAGLVPLYGLYYMCCNHVEKKSPISSSFFILLAHEGSHREAYQESQPSYDILRRWCQVSCTPNLHFPIANSASTQSQQPVNRTQLIKSSRL